MAERGVEGQLHIDLCWSRGRVTRVGIRSTRPLLLPRIFLGKAPADVVATLPLIYSVCGVAQGCAAAEALEQALAIPVSSACRERRRLLVAFETLREHVWRIELEWAGFLNRSPEREGVVQVVSLMRDFRATLFPEGDPFTPGGVESKVEAAQFSTLLEDLEQLLEARIFSRPAHSWLEISDRQGLTQWSSECATLAQEMLLRLENQGESGLGRARISALGALDAAYLNQRLTRADADRFIAQPDWHDTLAETTPYTRRCGHPVLLSLGKFYGNGLLARLTARLVELAALAGEIRTGITGLNCSETGLSGSDSESGIGISQIEAARGRLVHRVELEAGRVSNYQILAPTEWNFHPRGVLASGLEGLEADNEATLKQRADLLINAIDPCVDYQMRINRSECGEEPVR